MVFVETSIFTRQVQEFLSDDAYKDLQQELAKRPEIGSIIPGSGGLRKLRWRGQGRGKRGGVRVIYYWATQEDQILMLFIYPKNVRDDLSSSQLKSLRDLVKADYP